MMYDILIKIIMYGLVTLTVFLSVGLIVLVLLQRGEGAFAQPTTLYTTTIENSILKKNTIIVIGTLVILVLILNPLLYRSHKSTLSNSAFADVVQTTEQTNNNMNYETKNT
jgi:protein translocase SecG subunit